MKKKDFEKLINEQDVEVNFENINSKIDYDKYEKVPVKPRVFQFKVRYAVLGALALIFATVGSNSLYCSIYNKNLNKRIEKLVNEQIRLEKLSSKNDLNQVIYGDELTFDSEEKTSWIEYVTDSFVAKGTAWAPSSDLNNADTSIEQTPTGSYQTNVQVDSIDEADVAKCDGEYIYAAYGDVFKIYDLDGNIIASDTYEFELEEEKTGFGDTITRIKEYNLLYLQEEYIVLLGTDSTIIYEFKNQELEIIKEFEYDQYRDSRLVGNELYLVTSDRDFQEINFEEENVYHTSGVRVQNKYSLHKFNLETKELITTVNLNSGSVTLYMSENNIYLATNVYFYSEECGMVYITICSIFDNETLNPVGAIKVDGIVMNQFAMDEYNGYFRVVTYDNNRPLNKINTLEIFSLETLEKVGEITENLGEGNQRVRSVSFDKDKCHVVTYETKDPLYEIDLSDVTNPRIVSIYKAPGYSSYLQNFEVNGEQYLFGIGYTDNSGFYKISIYKETSAGTTQIGEDFIISEMYISSVDLQIERFNYNTFAKHKALFVYQDNDCLYLGWHLDYSEYYIFKIDVSAQDVVSVYKTFELDGKFDDSRCFLINEKLYITHPSKLIINDFE